MSNKTTRETVEEVINGWSQLDPSGLTEVLLDWFVIIPRTEMPEVVDMDAYLKVSGENMIKDFPGDRNRELGLAHLAVAEYKAAQKQAENEAKRSARRDEIARDIHTTAYGDMSTVPGYANSNNALQEAIDRIIALEEASK